MIVHKIYPFPVSWCAVAVAATCIAAIILLRKQKWKAVTLLSTSLFMLYTALFLVAIFQWLAIWAVVLTPTAEGRDVFFVVADIGKAGRFSLAIGKSYFDSPPGATSPLQSVRIDITPIDTYTPQNRLRRFELGYVNEATTVLDFAGLTWERKMGPPGDIRFQTFVFEHLTIPAWLIFPVLALLPFLWLRRLLKARKKLRGFPVAEAAKPAEIPSKPTP